jgi:murein DD-endopeptidase MepM/ murein hydrolase activator NlpD
MIKPRKLSRKARIFLVIVSLLAIGVGILFFYSTPVTENLDSYEYDLPFKKGAKYKIVQGYGGLFSHNHIAALDIEMPVGTPVYASREGTVYRYKDDSNVGGFLPKYKSKANYIIIKHDDGSFGCYWHLQKNGVLVKSGRVSKGQQIGLSGATGQALNPHLHFSVKKMLNYEMNSFVRTKFRTTKGVLLLERGETYERPID